MKKYMFVMSWMMLVLLWLAACTSAADEAVAETEAPVKWPDPTSPSPEFDQADVGLANPASVHCEEQGGRLEMRDDENGSHGVCVFDDGSECEEWAFWRGECGPASDEARVNVALEAGLAQAVKLEILELDPATESSEPYRLRLTIEDEFQLGDVVRSLNTATPRTPKTLCIPSWQLRFYQADGTQQTLGYLCDAAQPTLSGEQDFWQNQEATAPALFVALVDSHLESAQEPAPGQSLNPVAQANLAGTQRIEVLLQTYSEEGGIAQASVQPLADISDPVTVAAIVASLDAELPLGPRARCMANGALVFYRPDGSTYHMGYGCELESATFLRGDEGYWQGQDVAAPPALHDLVQESLALYPVAASTEETPRAVAWYGYVTGDEQGDRLVLYPQGAGELALLGDEDEHEAQIAALRDKPELVMSPMHDAVFTRMAENGLKMKYVLTFWDKATYPGGEGAPCARFKTEGEIERYLEFVRFIVRNFKDRIEYYEMWNEPDIENYCPKWIEVDDYINLVERTVPVIREEYPEAKIVVGAVSNLRFPPADEYLYTLLQSDIMPLVDVVSWHANGPAPDCEYFQDFYYEYPSIVQYIKDTASAHGFDGEYQGNELGYDVTEIAEPDSLCVYSPTVAAKYSGRGIVMHLGMDIGVHISRGVGNLGTNLCTVMAGAEAAALPVQIQTTVTNTVSYTFALPNDDWLVALWTDGIAAEYDPGVPTTVTLPGFVGHTATLVGFVDRTVTGVDVLHGFEQPIITSEEDGNLVIRNLLVKDYPIILRLNSTRCVFLPIVMRDYPR